MIKANLIIIGKHREIYGMRVFILVKEGSDSKQAPHIVGIASDWGDSCNVGDVSMWEKAQKNTPVTY